MTSEQRTLINRIATDVAASGGCAYMVGGCVRDALMGREVKDIDIEVFGIASDKLHDLLSAFGTINTVGASFGVYKLTVGSGEPFDISIPRRDSKVSVGHKGFVVTGDPTMTVEDAARRRDFTINAIYYNPLTGFYVDPFDGIEDITHRVLRIVDTTRFADDSLRVLRAVQFVARFGFTIDPASADIMSTMDLSDLPAERVWGEFAKLLRAAVPSTGLMWMRRLGVTLQLFPELHDLIDVPQDPEWHPEGDVWVHTLQVVDQMRAKLNTLTLSPAQEMTLMLAALCHDLGKATTTRFFDGRWRAHGHEQEGVEPTIRLLDTLNVHTIDGYDVRSQVLALVEHHLRPHEWFKARPSNSAFRRLSRKVDLVLLAYVAEADSNGRHPKPKNTESVDWFLSVVGTLDLRAGPPKSLLMGRHLIDLGMKPGPDIGKAIAWVFEKQLDGEVTTVDDAIAWARVYVKGERW